MGSIEMEVRKQMVQPQVYEGTAEEIARQLQQSKLMGRLRAIIVPENGIGPNGKEDMGPTFAEILAPLQHDFEATGMTDEELGEFIDAEIKAHRTERRAKPQPSNG